MEQVLLDEKVPQKNLISDTIIDNLIPLSFETIDDEEIIKYIYEHCKKLLRFAKDKNSSKEVAKAIDLSNFDVLGEAIGSVRTVDIRKMMEMIYKTSNPFIIIHNHPTNNSFSYRDLSTFFSSNQLRIMVVIGNLGAIYTIEKTDYLFQNQLVSVRKSLLDWKHGNIDANTMYEQLSRFGVIYSEI